jgi:hypothetical protein
MPACERNLAVTASWLIFVDFVYVVSEAERLRAAGNFTTEMLIREIGINRLT